jgi:serine/arginine repetitive matrix protein 2
VVTDHRASFESKLARRSLGSLVSSTTDRPSNVDNNYPWADDMPAIDISLPAPTHRREASQPRASNLCLSESSDGSQSDYGVYDESASSGDPFKHTRKASKHSILGSISRRIGIHSGPFDTTGYAIGPDSLRNDDRSVGPGDRYPTTGLTPPPHSISKKSAVFSLTTARAFNEVVASASA